VPFTSILLVIDDLIVFQLCTFEPAMLCHYNLY